MLRRIGIALDGLDPRRRGDDCSRLASSPRGYHAWQDTPTGSTARLRGLAAVSSRLRGRAGARNRAPPSNGGATWQQVGPPGTQALQFRDIEAFDADHAVIMSVGNSTDFRIYVTSNGGQTWALTFVNQEPTAFYDCMTFSTAVAAWLCRIRRTASLRVIATDDGGLTWHVTGAQMPQALPGEFAFAASGQCITSDHGRRAWFGTGGAAEARVFHSDDGGASWTVASTPIASGPTAGIFALAFRGQQRGLAVGGDFLAETNSPDNFARTSDGGASWSLLPAAPAEYRSGATWLDGLHGARSRYLRE